MEISINKTMSEKLALKAKELDELNDDWEKKTIERTRYYQGKEREIRTFINNALKE